MTKRGKTMNKILLVALMLLAVSPAKADSLLVEACKRAAAHWYMENELKISRVDDFSNLKPRRVRMKHDGGIVPETIECIFSATAKPVGVREFCATHMTFGCAKAGHRRFDEVAELLRRDGY